MGKKDKPKASFASCSCFLVCISFLLGAGLTVASAVLPWYYAPLQNAYAADYSKERMFKLWQWQDNEEQYNDFRDLTNSVCDRGDELTAENGKSKQLGKSIGDMVMQNIAKGMMYDEMDKCVPYCDPKNPENKGVWKNAQGHLDTLKSSSAREAETQKKIDAKKKEEDDKKHEEEQKKKLDEAGKEKGVLSDLYGGISGGVKAIGGTAMDMAKIGVAGIGNAAGLGVDVASKGLTAITNPGDDSITQWPALCPKLNSELAKSAVMDPTSPKKMQCSIAIDGMPVATKGCEFWFTCLNAVVGRCSSYKNHVIALYLSLGFFMFGCCMGLVAILLLLMEVFFGVKKAKKIGPARLRTFIAATIAWLSHFAGFLAATLSFGRLTAEMREMQIWPAPDPSGGVWLSAAGVLLFSMGWFHAFDRSFPTAWESIMPFGKKAPPVKVANEALLDEGEGGDGLGGDPYGAGAGGDGYGDYGAAYGGAAPMYG